MPGANILSGPGPGAGTALVGHNGPALSPALFHPPTPGFRASDSYLYTRKDTYGFFRPRGPQRYLTRALIGIIARFSTP